MFINAVLALALVTGCTNGSSTGDDGDTPEPTDTGSDEAADGGTLTIAVDADLRTRELALTNDTTGRLVFNTTVADPLFSSDESGSPVPALATGAEPSEDFLNWTITLREGVQFHSGKEFTAADVVALLDYINDPANGSEFLGDITNLAEYEAVDDYTVRITLAEPDAGLTALFTDNLLIPDLEDLDKDLPIGTGPYKWNSYAPGDQIVFDRFDDHWRGTPPLDQVIFRIIPDAQVAALELQNGGVDIVPNYIAIDAIPTLEADPNIELYNTTGSTFYHAYLNHEKARRGGYEDPEAFREGMAYLWNHEEIVPPIIGDFGTVANQPLPPWQFGHDPDLKLRPYDPERGKELLAQAGVEEGDTITLFVHNRPYNCDHGTAFQSHLNALGYNATLECFEPGPGLPHYQEFEWDLLFYRNSGRPTAALMYQQRWHSVNAEGLPDVNTLIDEEIDSVIEEMAATQDQERYEELSHEAADLIMNQEIATLPGYWDNVWVATRSDVKGFKLSPLGYYGLLMNEMGTVTLDR